MKRPVYVLVEPSQLDPNYPTMVSARQYDAVDEFATLLGAAAGATIPVIEVPLAQAPSEAVIVGYFGTDIEFALRELPAEAHGDLCRRLVMMNAGRSDWRTVVERWELAAAIEEVRYFDWRRDRIHHGRGGIIGRKDIAAGAGISLRTDAYYQTPRYTWLDDDRCPDLPSLLWAYLEAYEEMVLG